MKYMYIQFSYHRGYIKTDYIYSEEILETNDFMHYLGKYL